LLLGAVVAVLAMGAPSSALTVEGEGQVRLEPGATLTEARDRALRQALEEAVLKAARRIEPTISAAGLKEISGDDHLHYVNSYRIMGEQTLGRLYRLSIEADVDELRLRNRLKGWTAKRRRTPLARPDSISIDVVLGGLLGGHDRLARSVRNEIATVLIGNGYKVVRGMGGIQVTATVTAEPLEGRADGATSPYRSLVTVMLRARDVSGREIASAGESTYELRGRAFEGREKIAALLARSASKKLALKLNLWSRRPSGPPQPVTLSFGGVTSYTLYRYLDTMVSKSLGDSAAVERRIFEGDRITYELRYDGDTGELAALIAGNNPLGFAIVPKKRGLRSVEFELVPQE